jgi:hypothetical protein
VTLNAGATGYYLGSYTWGSTVETNAQMPMPCAGTLDNLIITTRTVTPSTGQLAFMVRVNGNDTGIAVTLPANTAIGNYSDLTHNYHVNQGDLVSVRFINSSTVLIQTPAGVSYSVRFR